MSEYLQRGVEHYQNHDFENAKLAFVKALEANPYDYESLCFLGAILAMEKEYDSARTLLENAIAINPRFAQSYNNLGMLYYETKEYDKAVSSFIQALHCDDNDPMTYNNLATAYKALGKYDEAKRAFTKAIEKNPNFSVALYNLGNLYFDTLREYEKGYGCYKKAYSSGARHRELLLKLIRIAFYFDEDKESEEYFAAVSKENEDLETVIYRSIYAWLKKGEYVRVPSPPYNIQNEQILKFALGYGVFLPLLGDFRRDNPQMYRACQGEKKITLIGDSHVLSYAGLCIDDSMKIDSKVIVGAKAWHLAAKERNIYKTAFEKMMRKVPKGQKVVLFFGEIDCRDDEGFLKQKAKDNAYAIERNMDEVIRNYVDFAKKAARKRRLDLYFANVPPPLASYATKESTAIVVKFNEVLKRYAKESIVDRYEPYKREDGFAKEESHIDSVHLYPSMEIFTHIKG